MLDMIVVGIILCVITSIGVLFFRRTREKNPRLAFIVVGCLFFLELIICMLADMIVS